MFTLPRIKIGYLSYGYANARVHGMKGLLLSKDSYKELVNLDSVDGMVELLQNTHYKKYLLDAAAKYSGSMLIESASGKHYADIASKISRIAPDDDKRIIDALLLKWDIINLKTVIASKKLNSSFSEIKPMLIPAGSLDVPALESIHNSHERDLFNELRKHEFGKELFSQSMQLMSADLLNRFKKSMSSIDQYSQVQVMLDTYGTLLMEKHLKTYISDAHVKLIYKLLRKEISTTNILLIERLKRNGIKDPDKINNYLLSEGSLPKKTLSDIISSEKLEDLFPHIRRYFPEFKPEKISNLVDLEIELQKALSAEKVKVFHRVILSIGTLLGFLLIKEEEMNNLRKIAKAKEFGISREEVMKTLLIAR